MALLYTNIASLSSKFNDLLLEVTEFRPSIIALTETWLNPSISDDAVHIENYSIYRDDRLSQKGGGVCFYVDKIKISKFFKITQICISVKPYNSLWLKFEGNEQTFVIACIYRPPTGASFNNHENDKNLFNTIQSTINQYPNLIIMGDFNFPCIDWSAKNTTGQTIIEKQFSELLLENNLSQIVTEPTRFRSQQRPSLPDLVILSDVNLVSSLNVSNPVGTSDHSKIEIELQIMIYSEPNVRIETTSIVDYTRIDESLLTYDWNGLDSLNAEEQWKHFKSILQTCITTNSRLFTNRLRKDKPWINQHMLDKIKYKAKLWKKFKRQPTEDNFSAYTRFSNQLKSDLQMARCNYENSILNKPKLFYSHVRKFISSRVSVPLVRNASGLLCSDHTETANTLADSFATTYNLNINNNIPSFMPTSTFSGLSYINFTPDLVKSQLCAIKLNTAPGPDQIPPKLLRTCAASLSGPLAKMMTKSFLQGTLPYEWLQATITPLYKSGDKLDPANYRPVSLTSTCCKIMEKVIVKELLTYIRKNNLIPEHQHGFLPGRSVVTNLLSCTNLWTKMLDTNQPVDIIYLDFSKAFDKVAKLESYGVTGNLLDWIRAFLSNRNYCVKVCVSFISKVYITYIRPHLEFAIPVWRPYLLKDIDLLERTQHLVTRWTHCLRQVSYEQRLEILKIPDLRARQNRADAIQIFRLTHGLFPGVTRNFLQIQYHDRLRGHSYKLKKEPFKTTVRKNYLTNRAFDIWNGLPDNVVAAVTVSSFKNQYDTLQ
ncbi:LINE-1 reverse transcriptase homolog-like Protein [Tribolium castaneum]|uniref:LINE-1 reverse transcriptase homolog-like Protein n=1 Tax=Tribolium castaneum TaxID=7070 RepID=D7GYL9_TRICA|nr:LINE-1 reverse transcriptase homolog-like Protein [Tribolium castaneum]